MINIGINGLGRIGRSILRSIDPSKINVKIINEINPDKNNIVYTTNYDTIFGKNENKFELKNGYLCNKFHKIFISQEQNLDKIKFEKFNLDFIVDSSGISSNVKKAKKIIKKLSTLQAIIFNHCPPETDFQMVLGANEDKFIKKSHKIISSSICDATALAPVLNIINKNFKILGGFITTAHPWLNYQNLMDGPSVSWSKPGSIFDHYALGRSAIGNLIPKPTTAVDETLKVLNFKKNFIGSFSYRVPTSIVGSADLTIKVKKNTNKTKIISLFKEFERKQKFNIIKNNFDPLVSLDFIKSDYSVNIDHRWTMVNKDLIKLVLWYDNEYGYSRRVLDQLMYINNKK